MKLILLALILCGLALLLLSVRVIFSPTHSFLTGHACKGVPKTVDRTGDSDHNKEQL